MTCVRGGGVGGGKRVGECERCTRATRLHASKMINVPSHPLIHYSLTHSLTHSLSHPRTHYPLTHPPTDPPTHTGCWLQRKKSVAVALSNCISESATKTRETAIQKKRANQDSILQTSAQLSCEFLKCIYYMKTV